MQTKPDKSGGRSSNSRRCDGDENVKLESDSQFAKERRPTNSSDGGRTIEVSEEQSINAPPSIRTTSESSNNGEFASFSQRKKQEMPSVLTDDGRMIDSRETHEKNAS
jgi:hypothetical protein